MGSSFLRRDYCADHGFGYVCDSCPHSHTDSAGFVHPSEAGPQRRPVRRCRGCGDLTAPGAWNREAWWWCVFCAPRGQTWPKVFSDESFPEA